MWKYSQHSKPLDSPPGLRRLPRGLFEDVQWMRVNVDDINLYVEIAWYDLFIIIVTLVSLFSLLLSHYSRYFSSLYLSFRYSRYSR